MMRKATADEEGDANDDGDTQNAQHHMSAMMSWKRNSRHTHLRSQMTMDGRWGGMGVGVLCGFNGFNWF